MVWPCSIRWSATLSATRADPEPTARLHVQTRARYLWNRLEAYHGMIYFVPEADQHYTALGLDRGMMGYFASRVAAMGEVPAAVVVATFYNFEPQRIHRLLPEAWRRASASSICEARLRAVDAALGRLLGERLHAPDVAATAALLRSVCDECRPEGRPLYSGHAAQPWPEAPHLALWHAITLLREYRGDGHVAALTVSEVSGCEALVMHAATGAVPAAVLQATRGWNDDEWAAAVDALRRRGWLDIDGRVTESGRHHRDEVEQRTDDLAAAPWALLTDDEADSIASIGGELSRTIRAAGTFGRLPNSDSL